MEPKKRKRGCGYCMKMFVNLLCSNIALCAMVVGYSIAGGFLFQLIEAPNEKKECLDNSVNYQRTEDTLVTNIVDIFKNISIRGNDTENNISITLRNKTEIEQNKTETVLKLNRECKNNYTALNWNDTAVVWNDTETVYNCTTYGRNYTNMVENDTSIEHNYTRTVYNRSAIGRNYTDKVSNDTNNNSDYRGVGRNDTEGKLMYNDTDPDNYTQNMLDIGQRLENCTNVVKSVGNSSRKCVNDSDSERSSDENLLDNMDNLQLWIDGLNESQLAEIREILKNFSKEVLSIGYDGMDCSMINTETGHQWSYASSLLFSVTVITTVGYGNVTPKTNRGKGVLILYALVGIPLMLLCLANIGVAMAHIFRLRYNAIYQCCVSFRKKRKRRATFDLETNDKDVTSSTSETDEDEEEKPPKVVNMPLTLVFSILAGYVVAGAFLFGMWEGWNWIDSLYFSFVTISTIGFGDVVPGVANHTNDQRKLAGTALYVLFGMATISMCFSLLQHEIVGKVRRLAIKIGMLEEEEESDEIHIRMKGAISTL